MSSARIRASRRRKSIVGYATIAGATIFLVLAGCEEEVVVGGQTPPPFGPGAPSAPTPGVPADGAPADAAPVVASPPAPPEFRDDTFVEAETNRDPFRSFMHIFNARPVRDMVQREVMMPRTSVEDMKLIAIIGGLPNPAAMLVDQDGTGYTVRRGDYIGRSEMVQTGSESVPITLNWRVERIRLGVGNENTEVILTREDPTSPDRPPVTRVIPLHDPGEEQRTSR